MKRLYFWALSWYKTLTLPRHIKKALREPINPDDFIEVQKPEICDSVFSAPLEISCIRYKGHTGQHMANITWYPGNDQVMWDNEFNVLRGCDWCGLNRDCAVCAPEDYD